MGRSDATSSKVVLLHQIRNVDGTPLVTFDKPIQRCAKVVKKISKSDVQTRYNEVECEIQPKTILKQFSSNVDISDPPSSADIEHSMTNNTGVIKKVGTIKKGVAVRKVHDTEVSK